ncbi:MAG: hypothetical protein ACT4P3_10350 [Betaproteobacteria bacterium]
MPVAVCEVYSIAHRNRCRWKWRHRSASGSSVDCAEEYEAFFDCVRAARDCGYEPRSDWTRVLPSQSDGR